MQSKAAGLVDIYIPSSVDKGLLSEMTDMVDPTPFSWADKQHPGRFSNGVLQYHCYPAGEEHVPLDKRTSGWVTVLDAEQVCEICLEGFNTHAEYEAHCNTVSHYMHVNFGLRYSDPRLLCNDIVELYSSSSATFDAQLAVQRFYLMQDYVERVRSGMQAMVQDASWTAATHKNLQFQVDWALADMEANKMHSSFGGDEFAGTSRHERENDAYFEVFFQEQRRCITKRAVAEAYVEDALESFEANGLMHERGLLLGGMDYYDCHGGSSSTPAFFARLCEFNEMDNW